MGCRIGKPSCFTAADGVAFLLGVSNVSAQVDSDGDGIPDSVEGRLTVMAMVTPIIMTWTVMVMV